MATNRTNNPISQAADSSPRVPLGEALDLTDEELDDLAEITPADILDAKQAWRRDAPDRSASLLDAETTQEGEG